MCMALLKKTKGLGLVQPKIDECNHYWLYIIPKRYCHHLRSRTYLFLG